MTPQIYENKGRKKLTSFLTQLNATEISGTEDQFDELDMYASLNSKKYVFEIKCRNTMYSDIYLVKHKFNALVNRVKNEHLSTGFFVINFQNRLYLWDLAYIIKRYKQFGTHQQWLPSTTCGFKHQNDWILEDVIDLPTKDALKVEFVNNKWQKYD